MRIEHPSTDLVTLSLVFSVVWGIAVLFGRIGIFGSLPLMDNSLCYPTLGCNIGFFGYDGFTHLLAGFVEVFVLLLCMYRYPRLNMLSHTSFKDICILVGMVICLGFFWELIEFFQDHYSILVLHMNLFSPNGLSQPTNGDTIGDMSLAMLGAFCAIVTRSLWDKTFISLRGLGTRS